MRIARLDAALVFLDNGEDEPRLLGARRRPAAGRARAGLRQGAPVAPSTSRSSPSSAGVEPGAALPGAGDRDRATTSSWSARGRTVGVLEIYGSERAAAVTEDALASLAAHAVSAFENAHLYREVGDREQRLQDALRQLLIAQEEERRRVAYELHDGLAQVAAATHLSLQTFASQYRPRSSQRQQQLERSVDLARRVVREARQVIAGLRPTVLDDFGLERALRLHVQELVGRAGPSSTTRSSDRSRLPGPIETVLYRIAQEALTNVRKHAETLAATVSLQRGDGYVELESWIAGVGFKPGRAGRDDAGPATRSAWSGCASARRWSADCCVVQSEPGRARG